MPAAENSTTSSKKNKQQTEQQAHKSFLRILGPTRLFSRVKGLRDIDQRPVGGGRKGLWLGFDCPSPTGLFCALRLMVRLLLFCQTLDCYVDCTLISFVLSATAYYCDGDHIFVILILHQESSAINYAVSNTLPNTEVFAREVVVL